MLIPLVERYRAFLGQKQTLLALASLPVLGIWIFSRVWMVNPAILGDEYLYSMNARKAGPWDPPLAGDFSNYLFNFVYQSTNLCGDAFYTCGKILNISFFLGFIFTIFVLSLRFLPFWGAYLFMIAAALSPVGIYTSMFLPESMYFFFIGLVLVFVLRAMTDFTWRNWALAGMAIGIASLVKPHAWLSAIPVGITLLVVGLFDRQIGVRKTGVAGIALLLAAALARVTLGLLVAGPKALGFFGQYLGVSTIEAVIGGSGDQVVAEGTLPSNPMDGVFSLFASQLTVHVLTISALMAFAVVGLSAGLFAIIRDKRLNPASAFSLFGFIWLVSMTVEIVMFTGWVTGAGDDHTLRVLIRYYEFLFVIIPLSGLSALVAGFGSRMHVLVRWAIAGVFATLLSQAFTGFFGSLTVQIADAPTLAGLIVNQEVFNSAAIVGLASLVLFASFPRWSPWAFVVLLPITMVGTGWQIQDQYQLFRGERNAADVAGQKIARDFTLDELSSTWVVGTSRFEATNVAIWADNADLAFDIFAPGSQLDASMAPEGTKKIVATGDIQVIEGASLEVSGEGFAIYGVN